MTCRECDACHETTKKLWTGLSWLEYETYECYGVKEPFVIKNIDKPCTEYPEKAMKNVGCSVCSDDYNQYVGAYIHRFDSNNEDHVIPIDVKFCPNCGRALKDGEKNA